MGMVGPTNAQKRNLVLDDLSRCACRDSMMGELWDCESCDSSRPYCEKRVPSGEYGQCQGGTLPKYCDKAVATLSDVFPLRGELHLVSPFPV